MSILHPRDWARRVRHARRVGLPDTHPALRPVVRVCYVFGWLHSPSYVGPSGAHYEGLTRAELEEAFADISMSCPPVPHGPERCVGKRDDWPASGAKPV